MKKNGFTNTGTQRWRCTNGCRGSSIRNSQQAAKYAATFRLFYTWITTAQSLTSLATAHHLTRQTLHARFQWCWLIRPDVDIDHDRVYDQLFIDGTYLNNRCLLIVASFNHVVAWLWCDTESTTNYTKLISQLKAPPIITLDGGQGAYTAIKQCWPTSRIQRCTVHIQRHIRRQTTTRPRTEAGKAIYALAQELTKIKTTDQAFAWSVNLNKAHEHYKPILNKKTYYKRGQHPTGKKWDWTHQRDRRAMRSLNNLNSKNWLFTYLEPPEGFIGEAKATTNSLEGGINSPLKLLARHHRGMSGEHQRTAIDWWLASKTQLPADPIEIARQQHWGKDALAKVNVLLKAESPTPPDIGGPNGYDTAIDTTYQHPMGVRQGWLGT